MCQPVINWLRSVQFQMQNSGEAGQEGAEGDGRGERGEGRGEGEKGEGRGVRKHFWQALRVCSLQCWGAFCVEGTDKVPAKFSGVGWRAPAVFRGASWQRIRSGTEKGRDGGREKEKRQMEGKIE